MLLQIKQMLTLYNRNNERFVVIENNNNQFCISKVMSAYYQSKSYVSENLILISPFVLNFSHFEKKEFKFLDAYSKSIDIAKTKQFLALCHRHTNTKTKTHIKFYQKQKQNQEQIKFINLHSVFRKICWEYAPTKNISLKVHLTKELIYNLIFYKNHILEIQDDISNYFSIEKIKKTLKNNCNQIIDFIEIVDAIDTNKIKALSVLMYKDYKRIHNICITKHNLTKYRTLMYNLDLQKYLNSVKYIKQHPEIIYNFLKNLKILRKLIGNAILSKKITITIKGITLNIDLVSYFRRNFFRINIIKNWSFTIEIYHYDKYNIVLRNLIAFFHSTNTLQILNTKIKFHQFKYL